MALSNLWERARLALGDMAASAGDLVEPTIRLGVTGLAGAGKTVFITALVRNLTAGGRLPLFDAAAEGRISRAYLRPQPDDTVPRFDYERHLEALIGANRTWPESTRQVSQLRLTLEFEPQGFWARRLRPGRLNIDIVDYPGEWLLDLPLLTWSYADWSARTLAASRSGPRAALAKDWHGHLATLDPAGGESEMEARRAADLFKAYLRTCRSERFSLSALPPGRFLMPGDMEGSPALTFAPLDATHGSGSKGSLWAMMERRYESYKSAVVKPFFRNHFARLDRQIVLVDALAALNAGPAALADLETALSDILSCFRPGTGSWLAQIVSRRIDRILFAATKADHLHRASHDRLEAILRRLTQHAIERAEFSGAQVQVAAIAAIRTTHEATASQGGKTLDCIAGTPLKGERIAGHIFDGKTETAVFPGELPDDPDQALRHGRNAPEPDEADLRILRFRPPKPVAGAAGEPVFPHIRLDRALNFLIGDRL